MSLLLSRPIPRTSIELGRLVLDPKYPTQDYCQPTIKRDNTDKCTNDGVDSEIPSSLEVETQQFENFHETFEKAKGTRLEASLLNILSLAPSVPSRTSTSISGALCVIHQLRDTNAFFSTICQQARVRTWLEEQSQRTRSTVYIVCGFKVLTDASVSLTREHGTSFEASVNVPSALVTGAMGVPIPGLDAGAGVTVSRESSNKTEYTAVGEQVFAVQYRKVSFSWFSKNKVDQAYLAKGNRWVSYVQARAGQADEDEEIIECDIVEEITSSDLGDRYTSLDIEGETVLYPADTD
ncbi:hypothetical protein FGRMN_7044 [Fusarium graminum]|nr:hypothetical protein FGRMN_7044 [Fusarium graminum]